MYKKDRDEKKFISGLSDYALDKIKRTEELKKQLKKEKQEEKVDWKKDLMKYIELFERNVPLPD